MVDYADLTSSLPPPGDVLLPAEMSLSERGEGFILHKETFMPVDYSTGQGKAIGYGHLESDRDPLEIKEMVPNGFTEEDAYGVFLKDIAQAERLVRQKITVPISQSSYDALVSFAFNVHRGFLSAQRLIQAVNADRYDEASISFLRHVKSGGSISLTLVRRRYDEARLYRFGHYAPPTPKTRDQHLREGIAFIQNNYPRNLDISGADPTDRQIAQARSAYRRMTGKSL